MKDLNLVPQYIIDARKQHLLKQRVAIWGGVFVLVIIAVLASMFIQKMMLKSDIDAINKRIGEMNIYKTDSDLVGLLKQDVEFKKAIRKNAEAKNEVLLGILEKLEKQIPKGIGNVNVNLNTKDNVVNITARAASPYSIADLIYNLSTEGAFEDVYVPAISLSGDGAFSITFKYTTGSDKNE